MDGCDVGCGAKHALAGWGLESESQQDHGAVHQCTNKADGAENAGSRRTVAAGAAAAVVAGAATITLIV